MIPPRPLVAAALVATVALLTLGAAPASAANGDGAVIFNPDGTPIGSELVYGASSIPQYVYTSQTGDDDSWGLGIDGVPVHSSGAGGLGSGISLGFTVNVGGITYDEALINSNGGLCLMSSTDTLADGAIDLCTGFYDELIGVIADPQYGNTPDSYAAFFPLNMDQYPPDADTPVDGADADTEPDSCTFGSYLFEHEGTFYCSAVFWGTTTYGGKQAFAATWYHNPDYDADSSLDRYSTHQVVLVNDGDGNVTSVYNYDYVNSAGEDLSGFGESSYELEAACHLQYADGDLAQYYPIGVAGVNYTGEVATQTYLDLFGPTCAGGDNPKTTAELVNGGTYELRSNSLNSTVPGRYIFRMVDGLPTLAMPAAAPQLAATGASAELGFVAAFGLLAAGVMTIGLRRKAARASA